jgi:murein DD-endopeptidase MepM/ murein hydrolase activator NlpD
MDDSFDTTNGGSDCTMCGGVLVAGRFVQAEGAALRIFCSRVCLRARVREQKAQRWVVRHRVIRRASIGIILIGAGLTSHLWPVRRAVPPVATESAETTGQKPAWEPLPPGWFGPDWPPAEASLLAVLGRDAWIHPLAGPFRRMPRTDARVFGAGRPGNRAVECRNGHCGVDLGGEIWGEQVRAVHDGVVDYVQRGPNPDRGGRFVRIGHHGGTVFTQYFHLAAIPRGLERGAPVKGGDLIGLLGDSGVKESQPHLHFSVSIRLTEKGVEKYIDPEPLVALWPLRVPVDGGEVGLVTIVAQPGVPLGSMPRMGRARKSGKQEGAPGAEPKPIPGDGEPAEETEPAEPSVEQ